MGNDADFLNNQSLLDGLTIRARAAYYLAVAESVFAAAGETVDHVLGLVAMACGPRSAQRVTRIVA